MSSEFRRFFENLSPKKRNEKKQKLEPSSPLPSTPSTSSERQRSNFSGEIERVFQFIDEDGDGKISPEELQRCVKAVGKQRLTAAEAEEAVESSDSDGDGLLSLEDFERLMDGNGLSEEDKTEELRLAFGMYCDDKMRPNELSLGSGCITAKSLKKMLSRLGESKSIKECMEMIKVYDVNGDGVLSFDEFAIMMRFN